MSLLLSQLSTNTGDATGQCAGVATVIGVGDGLLDAPGIGLCAGSATVVGYVEDAATVPEAAFGVRQSVRTRSRSADSRWWPVPPYEPY